MRRTVPAIFIDTNVPIYAAGRPHRYKQPSIEVTELASRNAEQFVTDVEVLQELINRYRSIRLWQTGRRVFDEFSSVMVGRVEPMLPQDAQLAASLADAYPGLDARDLIHLAVMNASASHASLQPTVALRTCPALSASIQPISRNGEAPSASRLAG